MFSGSCTSIVIGVFRELSFEEDFISSTVFAKFLSALSAIPCPILFAFSFFHANSTFSSVFNPFSVGHSPACIVTGTPHDDALKNISALICLR